MLHKMFSFNTRKTAAADERMRNFVAMTSLKIFLLFGVVFGPTIIRGQSCQRTNPDRDNNCVEECSPFIGCISDKRKCICDGDCGYSCVKKDFRCPRLAKPDNGQRNYTDSGRKFNNTAKFTCNQGFKLVGSSVRTCRGNEAWDGVQPICGKKCNDPGISNNNTLRHEQIRDDGFLPSQVLHYHCVSGYLIEGKNSITCQAAGTWDGSPPQCYQISCQPPKLPANSEVYLPTWFNASQGAKNGRALYLTCNPGYHKAGSSSLMTCQDGQWNLPTSFKCSPKICGDPGTPANGYKEGLLYHFKSKVTFHCDKCYTLVGAANRVCNADQSWSDETPTCQKSQKKCSKKTLISIGNGTAKSSSPEPVNCGDNITFSCNKGYKLIGSQQIVCDENGRWSDEMPSCKRTITYEEFLHKMFGNKSLILKKILMFSQKRKSDQKASLLNRIYQSCFYQMYRYINLVKINEWF